MAFPEIYYCVLCEEARPERLRLITLLGFYGVLPHVEILVKEFNKPIARLMFLVNIGKGQGQFRMVGQVKDDRQQIIAQTPDVPIELKDPARNNALGLSFLGLTFLHPGKHAFVLRIDDNVVYEESFIVGQGGPNDFPD